PPPFAGHANQKHPPAATSRRSLQACIASLPLQSSLMSKTYLKSDHFNGGGSKPLFKLRPIVLAQGFYRDSRQADRSPARLCFRPFKLELAFDPLKLLV